MSHFLDRLTFFARAEEPFADGHGVTTREDRSWEEGYRKRWQHDKIVRSTHGANCTGSCSWKIYVKGGIVTWETQQTDYPRTRPDLPNHEPRGCSRGASYSWYLYSGNRVKYPLVRSRLMQLWRQARQRLTPVAAWASIVEDPEKRAAYVKKRGLGGFVRATWDEVTEIVAAANAYTVRNHGPDRVLGFSPIPAMSMVSYAAGSRYLSLIGGVCMSFYDWYCDLPPSSPQTWGEQTDVPESADWYNAGFIMMWGSNVPQTRTPDAHFMAEARYRGTKVVTVTPDYSEASKFADLWLHPKQGTDAALAMAMGHVILTEWHAKGRGDYFLDYCRRYSDMPMLVLLSEQNGRLVPDRQLRASDLPENAGQSNNPDWKTVAIDDATGQAYIPTGSIGFRWGEQGKWNLEGRDARTLEAVTPRLSLIEGGTSAKVTFPYFGDQAQPYFNPTSLGETVTRTVPVTTLRLADGREAKVATVYDLFLANYGVERGFGDGAASYEANAPYTPAWAAAVCGMPAPDHHGGARVCRQRREDQGQVHGHPRRGAEPLVPLRHELPRHHQSAGDVRLHRPVGRRLGALRGPGEAAPAVGLDSARLRDRLAPSAAAAELDLVLVRAHRPVALRDGDGERDPLAHRAAEAHRHTDRLQRARRADGLAALRPQLALNPLTLAAAAAAEGKEVAAYLVERLKDGRITMSCEDPDHPTNWPRNLFVWRSNLLGSSGKGHEYFLKHLLGAQHGVQGKDLGEEGRAKPEDVAWHQEAPQGKLDLLVTLDFRMSTTCMYSDVVLPTATWYEKNDLNTSDMHPFIHPFTVAVDPAWESRSDWAIFRGIAKKFSALAKGHLGVEKDVVLTPLMHDSPAELGQTHVVKEWRKGEVEPVPGKTMPGVTVIERDYPNTHARYTSLGPLMEKVGNNGKGMAWKTEHEVAFLRSLNGTVEVPGVDRPLARIESDIDACEVIMHLAPETNGHVAVKAWEALGKSTGRDHTHLARPKEHEAIRFRDIAAQPRKIISSPIWSGLESEEVCYNAGYTNVHELIPWRTLTGRQQLYQDHPWMLAFGEALCVYRPPVDLKAHQAMTGRAPNGNTEITLNFITPHQKWGIHSVYTDNLIMLTLSRGGPIVWISEVDAKEAGIEDNDWVEAFNLNGALCARAVVSQRVPKGMMMMYHAQEKIVNVPGSEITRARGGIHNSVTRTVVKPTHMIGGYAQQAYGFNYYGTIGTNRDEFVVVRKMANVAWLDGPRVTHQAADLKAAE